MRGLLAAIGIFLITTALLSGFFSLNLSYQLGQQLAIVLFLLLLVLINALRFQRFKAFVVRQGKWYLLFLVSLIIQLFVSISGGIYSPFLILIHLFIIATSFLFPLYVPLLFLLSSLAVFGVQISLDPRLATVFSEDIGTVVLYVITFFAVYPLVQVVSQRYHVKNTLSKLLMNQLKVEETILSGLHEMVFVTDNNYRILSINDVVEERLHKSRSEVLGKPLFSVLVMKDNTGSLVDTSAISAMIQQEKRDLATLSLYAATGVQKVNLTVKPIDDLEGEVGQISFILSESGRPQEHQATDFLTIAVAKHDAILASVMKKLESRGIRDIQYSMLMMDKAQRDIEQVRMIMDDTLVEKKIMVDIALLCRQTVIIEAKYASMFNVTTDFSFVNFTEEDITPLIANVKDISYSQLTGPFFTAPCDIKQLGIILTKLIDLAVLIGAKEEDKSVMVSIKRVGKEGFEVAISASSHAVTPENVGELFTPYYGSLNDTTHLRFGSGLEGFLAKSLTDILRLPLKVQFTSDKKRVTFTLFIEKGNVTTVASLSQQA